MPDLTTPTEDAREAWKRSNEATRLWNRLVEHSENHRAKRGVPANESSRLDVVYDWLHAEGFARQVSHPEPVTDVYAVQKEVLDWMEAHDGVNGDTYRLYRMGRAHYAALEAARAAR